MHRIKLMVAAFAILAVPLALASCSSTQKIMGGTPKQTYALMPAERTPAATGVVQVGSTDDGNKELGIKVEHMPRPSELDSRLTTYVVWVDAGKGQPIPV